MAHWCKGYCLCSGAIAKRGTLGTKGVWVVLWCVLLVLCRGMIANIMGWPRSFIRFWSTSPESEGGW